MIGAAILLVSTALFGLVTVRSALSYVSRRQILDQPNWRSSHTRPTPRGGGLGILLAAIPAMVLGALLLPGERPDLGVVAATVGATLLLAALGYRDDRSEAGPWLKMGLQLAGGASFVLAAGWIEGVSLPGVPRLGLGALGLPLTVFWLVGFSNAFNFMDGIDGIAGLFAGVSGLFLAAAPLLSGGSGVAWIALPVAGAAIAFLSVNWSPARVFMGDVGSLPVGFLLAAAAVLGHRVGNVPFVTSFLILGPFLFDTLFTLGRRIGRRENLLLAHRSHLYQRLVIAGWSHARVTTLYGVWTVLTGGLGIVYLHGGTVLRIVVLIAALLSGAGVWLLVTGRERGRSDG